MVRDTGVSRRMGSKVARRVFSFRSIGDIIAELRRVTWPSRHETMRLSLMVIAVSATVGIFLGFVDLGFARIFDFILGN